jgi:hypothetical protein
MEISITIENNIRMQIVRGMVDIQAFTGYLKQLYNSPGFDPGMNILWDFREADFSLVPTQDIYPFQEVVRKYWGKGGKTRLAIVVSEDIGYDLTKIWQTLMEFNFPNRIEIFDDIETAKGSLNQSEISNA